VKVGAVSSAVPEGSPTQHSRQQNERGLLSHALDWNESRGPTIDTVQVNKAV
jgi:hypothetical protein